MLKIKKLTIQNFMSIGNHAETIEFADSGLTLILGENLDTANDISVGRNGCGKSAILGALCFGLFGQALTNISKDNLINNINKKNMFVIVEFEKNGHTYKIERGRKPNFFKFEVDDNIVNTLDNNEAQGENKDTQHEVEKILGFSHILFKNIIGLNTKTSPFLSLNSKQQREFIEELLGILLLSEKAEVLKELLKDTKNEIKQEEFKIKTLQESNERIQKSIIDLEKRSRLWDQSKKTKIEEITNAITELDAVDIESEIENHKLLAEYLESERKLNSIKNEITRLNRSITSSIAQINKIEKSISDCADNACPTCSQTLNNEKHKAILIELTNELTTATQHNNDLNTQNSQLLVRKQTYEETLNTIGLKPIVFYNDIDEAYNHKSSIDLLANELDNTKNSINPYIEQITTLENTSLQEINFDLINNLSKLRDHQEFLLKLLTSKDSFIRKKIIDQNLNYLNHRLTYYLDKLGLPHIVTFLNDLSVEIKYMGENLDFDQLSRGESTRLILALSWSFRDIFELLNHPINLLFIDELLDNGVDGQGVESAMQIIKTTAREQGKDIFIISHREELISKISNVLKVIKENGFTSLQIETDFGL